MDIEKEHYKLYLKNFNQSNKENNILFDRRFNMKNNNLFISFRPENKGCKNKIQKSKSNSENNISGYSENIYFDSTLKNLSKKKEKTINRGQNNKYNYQHIIINDKQFNNYEQKSNKCIQSNIGFTGIRNKNCNISSDLFNINTRRKCQKYNSK